MKAAGERPVDIARKVGITKNSVYRILRAKGMNQSAVRMAGEQTRADEIAAMKANGKRATDIARELGIDTSSVYRILRERQASESVAAEGAPSETE